MAEFAKRFVAEKRSKVIHGREFPTVTLSPFWSIFERRSFLPLSLSRTSEISFELFDDGQVVSEREHFRHGRQYLAGH
jgi:hypothetical protein